MSQFCSLELYRVSRQTSQPAQSSRDIRGLFQQRDRPITEKHQLAPFWQFYSRPNGWRLVEHKTTPSLSPSQSSQSTVASNSIAKRASSVRRSALRRFAPDRRHVRPPAGTDPRHHWQLRTPCRRPLSRCYSKTGGTRGNNRESVNTDIMFDGIRHTHASVTELSHRYD